MFAAAFAAAAGAKLPLTPPSLRMRIAVGGERAHRWVSKRAMMMAARAMVMVTATKRAMATATKRKMAPNRDIAGTGDGKATAATMAMGRVTAPRTWPLTHTWREGDDGGNGPWFVWQRKSDGGDNGNGEGDGTKDMATHTTPGERRMMVAMGHARA